MTDLQADVDALKELVSLSKAAPGQLATEFNPDRIATPVMVYSDADNELIAKFIMQASRSIPAIERLLGIVSGVEKLVDEMESSAEQIRRNGEGPAYQCRMYDAEKLKALLDREK